MLSHTGALMGVSGPATIATNTTQGDGLLLLLAALALIVLVIASSALLRRLRALPGDW
ncbi:MAG: hypothetical protein ACLPV4_23790 [Solirubrobacteraceae bacterium]